MEITGWVIEYWEPESKWISYYSSLDGSWLDAPSDNIVFIWLWLGKYKMRLLGVDCYFLVDDAFGGFNDENKTMTSTNDPGFYYYFDGDQLKHRLLFENKRPDYIPAVSVKAGVWVTEPCAQEFGLTGSVSREMPELRLYNG